jgi:hypothetical protein
MGGAQASSGAGPHAAGGERIFTVSVVIARGAILQGARPPPDHPSGGSPAVATGVAPMHAYARACGQYGGRRSVPASLGRALDACLSRACRCDS